MKLGFVSMPLVGHLNAMTALARGGRMWATANDGPGGAFAFSIPCEHSQRSGKVAK